MNYKTATFVLAGLLVLCIGFCVANYSEMSKSSMQKKGMHMMPDGTMMHDKMMGMEDMMMDMTANMEGKTGTELEKTFLSDMIVHHQGAVDMSQMLLKGNPRPELAQFARDIIDLQTKEIEMQKKWLSEWY
jgi:uncharacterized protein (DUF305 family)